MFKPTTHMGLDEAVIQTMLRMPLVGILQFNLDEVEVEDIARFLLARERMRSSNLFLDPRSARSRATRRAVASKEDQELSTNPPDAISKIKGSIPAFWSEVDAAWNLLRDELACARREAHASLDGELFPIRAQAWLSATNDEAHIFGTIPYRLGFSDPEEATVLLLREGAVIRTIPEPNSTLAINNEASHQEGITTYRTGAPGRPTSKDIWRAEARRRLQAGAFEITLAAFATELSLWLETTHPNAASGKPSTIENDVREMYRMAKVRLASKIPKTQP